MLDLLPETELRIQERATRAGIPADTLINHLLDQDEAAAHTSRILLSERDYATFINALDNPPPLTDGLIKAMAEYQQMKTAHPECNL